MAKLMVEGTATISGTDYTLRDTARLAASKLEVGCDSYCSYNGSEQSMTSMTLITGCSKTITTHGGPVVVFASVPFYQSGGTGAVYAYVDGNAKDGLIWTSNTTSKQAYSGMLVLKDIPAGSHTFELRARSQSGSYTAKISSYTNSCLCVFELPITNENVDYVTVPTDATVMALTQALNRAASFADLWYPVGSIYLTVNDVNPTTLFGGTWVRVGAGRMLISAGYGTNPVLSTNTYTGRGNPSYSNTNIFPAGELGGEDYHTLIVNEMPSHKHFTSNYNGNGKTQSAATSNAAPHGDQTYWNFNNPGNSSYTGGNQPHNNLPPYLAVYMWQRTA